MGCMPILAKEGYRTWGCLKMLHRFSLTILDPSRIPNISRTRHMLHIYNLIILQLNLICICFLFSGLVGLLVEFRFTVTIYTER